MLRGTVLDRFQSESRHDPPPTAAKVLESFLGRSGDNTEPNRVSLPANHKSNMEEEVGKGGNPQDDSIMMTKMMSHQNGLPLSSSRTPPTPSGQRPPVVTTWSGNEMDEREGIRLGLLSSSSDAGTLDLLQEVDLERQLKELDDNFPQNDPNIDDDDDDDDEGGDELLKRPLLLASSTASQSSHHSEDTIPMGSGAATAALLANEGVSHGLMTAVFPRISFFRSRKPIPAKAPSPPSSRHHQLPPSGRKRKPRLEPISSSASKSAFLGTDTLPLHAATADLTSIMGGSTIASTSTLSAPSIDSNRPSQHRFSRWLHAGLRLCCRNTRTVRNTVQCMNLMAKMVLWCTWTALAAAVLWYSNELYNHGTEPHLIAWFTAGAFVLLGFPISMWGIVSHLANYNQPHVQVYIVRILWMVPLYSIESWLAMRFHKQAIYIETLRDFYESYVLYSFLQFLIQVLGGEEALVLMLKDKSPTRGVHMWGLQWCVKPWLMGQPVSKAVYEVEVKAPESAEHPSDEGAPATVTAEGLKPRARRAVKRVQWKSPFFVKCKFGVLQYVLLKFLCAIAVLLLEWKGWYKEGEFSWRRGYLYICILTNTSQCWALYCLIFFYYATHTELSPIRPVGKFLSVKALVFFTWWQSVVVAILYQMDMIPPLAGFAKPESGGSAADATQTSGTDEWGSEDVAKLIQDCLICIEMFVAAVVHTFVFPHTEYSPQAVEARTRAVNQTPMKWHKKRLGRGKYYHGNNTTYSGLKAWKDDASKSSGVGLEMMSLDSGSAYTADTWEDPLLVLGETTQGGATSVGNQKPSPKATTSRSRSSSFDGSLHNAENTGESPVTSPAATSSLNSWDHDDKATRQQSLAPVQDRDDEDVEDESARQNLNDTHEGKHFEDDSPMQDGDEDDDDDLENYLQDSDSPESKKPGFVRAFIDSAIPRDLRDNTVGIVTGEYIVEKKTLLHHAATSDQYDLFSPSRRPWRRKNESQAP